MKKKNLFKSKLIYLFYFILFILVSIAIVVSVKQKNETGKEDYGSVVEAEDFTNEATYYTKNNIKISSNDVKYKTIDDNILHINIETQNNDIINNINIHLNGNYIKGESVLTGTNQIEIPIENEGKQELKIELLNGENVVDTYNTYFYYIEPYEHQFLENYSTKGLSTHFCRNDK